MIVMVTNMDGSAINTSESSESQLRNQQRTSTLGEPPVEYITSSHITHQTKADHTPVPDTETNLSMGSSVSSWSVPVKPAVMP